MTADGPASKRLPLGAVVAVLMLTALAYLVDLPRTPVYFGGDEAHFANQGYSLATTGRDLKGTRWPLFINLWDPRGDMTIQERFHAWYQPLLFYILALTLKLLPLNELSVRLPTAIVGGVLSPLLMYVVAMRLLKDRRVALFATLVLALAPPMLILSRQTLDYVCPVPFVLAWLWCLITFIDSGRVRNAFLGGLVLGIGFYSYIASWMFMPLCLGLSWLVFVRTNRAGAWRASLFATTGFVIPLLLLIPWAWLHPEMLRYTAGRYLVHEGEALTLSEGAQRLAGPASLKQMIGTYAGYFDPLFLFIRGGVSMTTSTTRSGVLLLPVAVFLVTGVVETVKRARRDVIAVVLLSGLLLAPLPATLVNERRMIQRELFMLPFAALVAAYGAVALFGHRSARVRWMSLALIIAMPVQFAYVYRDYFTHYKHRSAFYYDPVVFAEVAEVLLTADPPLILLTHDLNDAGPKWRYYSTKAGRTDLLSRTHYVEAHSTEVAAAPTGTFLVVLSDAATLDELAKSGQWTTVRAVDDIDERPASVVLRRN